MSRLSILCIVVMSAACGENSTGSASSEAESEGRTLAAHFADATELSDWVIKDADWSVDGDRLIVRGKDHVFITTLGPDKDFSEDIDASVQVEDIIGEADASYGLMIRHGSDGSYGLGLTAAGTAVALRWDLRLGVQYPIRLSEPVNVILKGPTTLRAITNGPTIDLYVDGRVVASVEDSTYLSGRVALWVAGARTVAFDDLLVTAFVGAAP